MSEVQVDLVLVAIMVVIVLVDWILDARENGVSESIHKVVFGFLFFNLFYGIMKHLWYLTGYAAIALALMVVWDRVSKWKAVVLGVQAVLVSIFYYLAFLYTNWFFVPVAIVILVAAWLVNRGK